MRQPETVQSPIGEADSRCRGRGRRRRAPRPRAVVRGRARAAKEVIDRDDASAWQAIVERIDYTFFWLDGALKSFARRRPSRYAAREVANGKKLLFKPNLVDPICVDPQTTPRFRQLRLHRLALRRRPHALVPRQARYLLPSDGDRRGGNGAVRLRRPPQPAQQRPRHARRPSSRVASTISTAAGRSTSSESTWRKRTTRRTATTRCAATTTAWRATTCRRAGRMDRLPVYDLNRIQDVPVRGPERPRAGRRQLPGDNLHKAIVGGEPSDAADRRDYPGCVLLSLPKLKVHTIALFTNAIKNLGIGLYPMEAAADADAESTRWLYSSPRLPMPGMKSRIPHEVWTAGVRRPDGPAQARDRAAHGRAHRHDGGHRQGRAQPGGHDIQRGRRDRGRQHRPLRCRRPAIKRPRRLRLRLERYAGARPALRPLHVQDGAHGGGANARQQRGQGALGVPAARAAADGGGPEHRHAGGRTTHRYRGTSSSPTRKRGARRPTYHVVGQRRLAGRAARVAAGPPGQGRPTAFSELITGHALLRQREGAVGPAGVRDGYAAANDQLTGSNYRRRVPRRLRRERRRRNRLRGDGPRRARRLPRFTPRPTGPPDGQGAARHAARLLRPTRQRAALGGHRLRIPRGWISSRSTWTATSRAGGADAVADGAGGRRSVRPVDDLGQRQVAEHADVPLHGHRLACSTASAFPS